LKITYCTLSHVARITATGIEKIYIFKAEINVSLYEVHVVTGN